MSATGPITPPPTPISRVPVNTYTARMPALNPLRASYTVKPLDGRRVTVATTDAGRRISVSIAYNDGHGRFPAPPADEDSCCVIS
jgi:hypothetical protein